MAITKQIVYIGDFRKQADELLDSWGKTNLYSTGYLPLDEYLGGGFGRSKGYEIVLLYGATGVGKSTVALNFLVRAINDGIPVGLLVLEDDMADVSNRFRSILLPSEYEGMNTANTVRTLPADALSKAWKLTDLLQYIGDWYASGIELILLDHLQFAFENAEAIKGENEYIAQRVFMQQLNQLMKQTKKTIILISHMNKAGSAKGMDRIVGSGSIAQASTKVIEVVNDEMDDTIQLHMRKSRFTKRRDYHFCMRLIDGKMIKAL